MGQEVSQLNYSEDNVREFRRRLREETKILKQYFDHKSFNPSTPRCGLELEAWLTTQDFVPSPEGPKFIESVDHPFVVPEISKFNFELNTEAYTFGEETFSTLERDLVLLWKKCETAAEDLDHRALTIGTLPTLRAPMLTTDALSANNRYHALNNRIMQLRADRPVQIDIEGRDGIHLTQDNVITECAATSLQIHMGVNLDTAVDHYNASILSSAFVAAVGANSPYFLGQEVWDESRIAIFEQSVHMNCFEDVHGDYISRVSLGSGYARESLLELFLENLDGYPVLLPELMDSDPLQLKHLCMQNGSIWRWNRPLVGIAKNGQPHLRLEFRIPSAGPSVKDAIANAVFQIALCRLIAKTPELTKEVSFETAKRNFYAACKHGLSAEITWKNGRKENIQSLLLNEILPECLNASAKLGISKSEADDYLSNIIRERVKTGQNGSQWQKSFVAIHGTRFQDMLEQYYANQKLNKPVHKWVVE